MPKPEIHFNYKIVAKHCCTQTGCALAFSKAYPLTDGILRGPQIPGSSLVILHSLYGNTNSPPTASASHRYREASTQIRGGYLLNRSL